MSKEIADRGNSFVVSSLNRAFGGVETEVLRVSGGGLNPLTGNQENLGDLRITNPPGAKTIINGGTALAGNPFIFAVISGLAAAGAQTFAGTVVGDKVVLVYDITDGTAPTNVWENSVSVAGQLQQTSASNLSAKSYLVMIAHQ